MFTREDLQQRTNETTAMYKAFIEYLKIGKGRNVNKFVVAVKKEGSYNYFSAISKRHSWVERAEIFDNLSKVDQSLFFGDENEPETKAKVFIQAPLQLATKLLGIIEKKIRAIEDGEPVEFRDLQVAMSTIVQANTLISKNIDSILGATKDDKNLLKKPNKELPDAPDMPRVSSDDDNITIIEDD
jgi:hypothetical protein